MFADLKKNEAVLNSALSKIPLGIVALNKDLKVQFINKMAQAIISNRTDVCLRSNYLVFDDITEHNQVKLAVEKTLKNSCPFISITLGQGGADDALTITLTKSVKKNTHLVNDAELIDDIVVLYLSHPQQAVCISPTVLQDMYRLTPSEANLALCLTNGSSLQSYSSDKQISIQTVRTQLKAVFHKLHVKSQTELVRKLVSSSANLIH
ncbi:hypothetical protein J9B83_12890 [Marinomonas sp. A79]|uniref:HTH luxR-type domain-containing protein n=1 Tax=Marinomonas vulgaris TaxID=2823372 RepID=A0ABS5HFM8_9GAMM|nr:LuxR C-terminal-related transcriptional regulator [Marinomonas vulgaris]MBR7889829.1 hypothetical protein [Marinomonas vulgaris]